ncbi:MAG: hypothetical protein ACLR34_03060 [Faecalibacterium prausnitzii]
MFFENSSAQNGSSPSVGSGRQQTTPAFREVKTVYGNNYRNSSLAAEEIQVLKAISRVSARLAQKLAALDNQRQTKEGGNRNVKTGGYGYGHTGRRNRQMTAKLPA